MFLWTRGESAGMMVIKCCGTQKELRSTDIKAPVSTIENKSTSTPFCMWKPPIVRERSSTALVGFVVMYRSQNGTAALMSVVDAELGVLGRLCASDQNEREW